MQTGRDWLDEWDVTGTVGRSMGLVKIPLIIATSRSSGGPGILDHCIVRIRTKGRELYRNPNYHHGEIVIRPELFLPPSGDKRTYSADRYVLFGKSFATAIRTHIAAHPNNRWLFQTVRCGKFSSRRIQQIVKKYAEEAGVRATPHTFRHQAITWLTRNSGLADAELQLITGHAKRETLAIYQHIALDGQVEQRYQDAMKDVGL